MFLDWIIKKKKQCIRIENLMNQNLNYRKKWKENENKNHQ